MNEEKNKPAVSLSPFSPSVSPSHFFFIAVVLLLQLRQIECPPLSPFPPPMFTRVFCALPITQFRTNMKLVGKLTERSFGVTCCVAPRQVSCPVCAP